jgi:hypothetical protein
MYRSVVLSMMFAACLGAANPAAVAQAKAAAAPPEPAWVTRSNQYTQMLLDVQLKYSPEGGSRQGLAKYDALITDPTRAAEVAQRKELQDVLATLAKAEKKEKDENVREDLEILQKTYSLQFREQDYQFAHKVAFLDASAAVYAGLQSLLDDKVAASRRPAAVVRLRKYAGVETGAKPFTDLLKQRTEEQMAKPGVVYPSVGEIEAGLGRDKSYVDGLQKLFQTYNPAGWQDPFAKLRQELADYDTWIRATVLPKARTDTKLAPEEYALALESYGIDTPAAQLAAMAHLEFTAVQAEMAPLAAQVAKEHGWKSTDYRDVIRELKKKQITGDATLPFYKARLKAIEGIVVANNLVTLPSRPAIVRMATAAETAQEAAPHMVSPPLLHNTGQQAEFVLPLIGPTTAGSPAERFDDFNSDAVSWAMTAHEARPGHELQFDSMVEHGVSNARAQFAFNSTNVEGWGLYSEWLIEPYEPADGKLMTLQLRLLRAARAFLDPGLQSGKVTQAEAYKVLENDVVLSPAYASEEMERFTRRAPGQANSYFYAFGQLLQLRKDTEAALGKKFDQKKYNDFVLAQGVLPTDLLRKAVMEDFVPREKKGN